ncbi:unnamed protein product [Sphagnum jensenii]|uniref:DUF569 domain-containing protein n=1 Tax=Sphagnum jensenii TaxID=128206 RepID=A0ABP1AV99_9BRYO
MSVERYRNHCIHQAVTGSHDTIRLKSINNLYLTALEEAFLLGETGNKVQQSYSSKADSAVEWHPIHVTGENRIKLKTMRGTYLRANGGIPPYKNSVTHDSTKKAVSLNSFLWEVEIAVDMIVDKLPLQSGAFQLPKSLKENPERETNLPPKIQAQKHLHQISAFQEEEQVVEEDEHHGSSRSPQQQLHPDSDGRDHGSRWGSTMRRHPDSSEDKKETLILRGNRSPHGRGINTASVPPRRHEESGCGRGSTMRKAPLPPPPTRRHISLEDVEESVKRQIRGEEDCSSSSISSEDESEHSRLYAISSDHHTERGGTTMSSEGRWHAISSDHHTERCGTRMSSSEESGHKAVRTQTHGREEGGWHRPVCSHGTEHGTRKISCDEREERRRAPPRTRGQHTLLHPHSSVETEHETLSIDSSNESSSERAVRTLAVKQREARVHPVSSDDDDEREAKISSEEREQRLRISYNRERTRILPVPPDVDEHRRRTISPDNDREHTSRSTSSSADKKKHRISSDDNGVHRVARVSIEIEERRSSRISPYDKEQRLQRVCNADEKECHRARASSSVEHSRERIHSADRRVPESPVAADLCHCLTLSSLDDGGVQQEELTVRHNARSLDHWKPKITEESPPMRRRHQEESSLEYYDDEQQQNSSNSRTLPPPSSTRSRVGRSIFFTVADEHSEQSTTHEEKSFILQSNSVSGLKEELHVRTNIDEDIFVCIRNPVNGKLCILTLDLPPDNVCMRVVVVRVNSEVGRKLCNPRSVRTRR